MLQDALKSYRLILSSQSPRRKNLLSGLDVDFEIIVRDGIEENVPPGMDKFEIPLYLAEHKSEAYLDLLVANNIIVTADTIVWHNNRELGKPQNTDHAVQMLSELSESMHEVVTGVCLRSQHQMRKFYSHSKVWFRALTSEEIDFYISKYKPFDKAGAYGIQEWLGYAAIERIDGSFYNVMGLPVQLLYSELLKFAENEKN
jgi:septum formation protein